jgi:hypothetical protein
VIVAIFGSVQAREAENSDIVNVYRKPHYRRRNRYS